MTKESYAYWDQTDLSNTSGNAFSFYFIELHSAYENCYNNLYGLIICEMLWFLPFLVGIVFVSVVAVPSRKKFVCVNLCVSGSWYKLKQILMILRPEKKEIIKIKTRSCYWEVLLHKDRFQSFAWNLYSFHSPSFIQEPQIMELFCTLSCHTFSLVFAWDVHVHLITSNGL